MLGSNKDGHGLQLDSPPLTQIYMPFDLHATSRAKRTSFWRIHAWFALINALTAMVVFAGALLDTQWWYWFGALDAEGYLESFSLWTYRIDYGAGSRLRAYLFVYLVRVLALSLFPMNLATWLNVLGMHANGFSRKQARRAFMHAMRAQLANLATIVASCSILLLTLLGAMPAIGGATDLPLFGVLADAEFANVWQWTAAMVREGIIGPAIVVGLPLVALASLANMLAVSLVFSKQRKWDEFGSTFETLIRSSPTK